MLHQKSCKGNSRNWAEQVVWIALDHQGQFASPHSSQNLLYSYVTVADEIVIDLFSERAT